MKILPLALFIIPFLAGCGANNTPPQTPIREKNICQITYHEQARRLFNQTTCRTISTYLDGLHFYSGDKNGQMEAHHYVTVLNEDVMQAVIYVPAIPRKRAPDGVEYVSANVYLNASSRGEKLCGTATSTGGSVTLVALASWSR